MDSHSDGTGWINGVRGNGGVGYDSLFEGFGMAYAVDDENVTFAFNANFGLNGHNDIGAADGNITWGDLFLNFDPTKTFQESQEAGTAWGIRFAESNDSQIGGSRTGVFEDITTADVTAANLGHQSYSGYNSQVSGFSGEVENWEPLSLL